MTSVRNTSNDDQRIQDTLLKQTIDDLEDWTILDLSDTQSEHSEFEILSCGSSVQYLSDTQDDYDSDEDDVKDIDTQLINEIRNIQLTDRQFTTEIMTYAQQCYALLNDPNQYYEHLQMLCQQYSPRLLQQIEIVKVQEWYILNVVLKMRAQEQQNMNWRDNAHTITPTLQCYSTKEALLELHAQQLYDLLARSRTYYASVQMVGSDYPLELLPTLVTRKNKEWKQVCDMHAKCINMLSSIVFAINSITSLVAPTAYAFETHYSYRKSRVYDKAMQLETRSEEFVFGAGTAATTRMFLAELTAKRLNDFNNCIIQVLNIMNESLKKRKQHPSLQCQVQAIIKKGKAIDNREDICDTPVINVKFIGQEINKPYKDMYFTYDRISDYCNLFDSLTTRTLLIVYEYTRSMRHESMMMQLAKK